MLSTGVAGYFLCWLHLTFPSTHLHSFPATPLPTLLLAELLSLWYGANSLPREGNLGDSVSAPALKHPSHRRQDSAGVTCKVFPTLL